MQISGVYERRLQLGCYTLIKALNAMVDRMSNDDMGWFAAGTMDQAIETPGRTREPPEDAAESGFGGLR
jgi:hypothetical protein